MVKDEPGTRGWLASFERRIERIAHPTTVSRGTSDGVVWEIRGRGVEHEHRPIAKIEPVRLRVVTASGCLPGAHPRLEQMRPPDARQPAALVVAPDHHPGRGQQKRRRGRE